MIIAIEQRDLVHDELLYQLAIDKQVRVLVVDDSEQWRQCLILSLQRIAAVVVVGEASDCLAAIEKAGKLQPDIVFLDIGLLSLNGIEVARQIVSISPASRVVFVPENPSAIQAAIQAATSY